MSPLPPRPALPTLRHVRLLWIAAAAVVIAAVTGTPDGPPGATAGPLPGATATRH